jgi:pyruvate kinase
MKKTKIICSIGPASCNYDVMKEMVLAGMNVARINFSHATIEERNQVEELVNEINDELGTNVAIIYDTKGPDFRTGVMSEGGIKLEEGKTIKIVKKDVLGTEESFTVNFKNVLKEIHIGDTILLEDGLMKLEVIDKEKDDLVCKIITGGLLKSKKGINVPGVDLHIEFLSKEDIEDIIYACKKDGDFLALSFVNSKENILAVRKILKEHNSSMKIISKIESGIALKNIDEIIEYSDGIMVARGDLGVEIPCEEIPIAQKEIIRKCREQSKSCIVATEMLASMYTSSRPTRAEVTDIANAVLDGCDAVMLSGETTVGKYPVEAVKYMARICENTEEHIDYDLDRRESNCDITGAIAHSVVQVSNSLKAKLIVTPTMTGYTARKISNLKPSCLVLATCPSTKIAKSLALNWGVYTSISRIYSSTDEIIIASKEEAMKFIPLKKKDIVIITGGFPNDLISKSTNLMKVEEI